MIDWSRIRQLREEVGAEDFDEVVALFTEEVDAAMAEMTAAPDRAMLGESLHFLKGSALSLGFAHLSDLCQAGETAVQLGQADSIDIDQIAHAYEASKDRFFTQLPQQIT